MADDLIRQLIADLEAKQKASGVDLSAEIEVLRSRLAVLTGPTVSGAGGLATAGGTAAGQSGVAVGRDVEGSIIVMGDGARIVIGDQPISLPAISHESALGRYLSHVISRNRYLQLQGIRSGGRLVNIELEHIYIKLKATPSETLESEEAWLAEEGRRSLGQRQADSPALAKAVAINVEEALATHRQLVILGAPGSGKTTLMRYLALCFARDHAGEAGLVQQWLGLPEGGALPILLPLRNVGAYLNANFPNADGTEGSAQLLGFLRSYLANERISVPSDFFDADLETGRVIILLDGMDEVGDLDLRRRVARLIEAFASAYPNCRLVVTSRIVGYTGPARLGEGFITTTVRDFTLDDVRQFTTHWHRLVAIGQMGPGADADEVAAQQTEVLMAAIRGNPRVRDLAINPLMLTVIALVHRDRVKLPERRAELYAEAVDVLLGKWDEARGVEESQILDDRPFETGDRRLLLQALALNMQEAGQREIDIDALSMFLQAAFDGITGDASQARQATERFITVIQERTGLLVEAGQGVYRFSHLTFQEYLVAVEVSERDDFVAYTVGRSGDAFWREVVLLEAGYLSTRNRAKTTRLIAAIADATAEPEPFHNLVLAAECLRDVGSNRVEGDMASALTQRLRQALDTPIPNVPTGWTSFFGRLAGVMARRRALLARRLAAATALIRIETGYFDSHSHYWTEPHGEPEWITVDEGEFWMGSDENAPESYSDEYPAHRVWLPTFKISRTLVTNAQYALYVQATGCKPPRDWEDGYMPKDKSHHPVVWISWHDAQQYCLWLSEVTGQSIRLPSEAEWEKAARGAVEPRVYPWGDTFDPLRCNSRELHLQDTTPVGMFPNGASPYGCLDMSGNVWEWTRSLWGEDVATHTFVYPYDPADGREDLQAPDEVRRVVRGGSFYGNPPNVRCAVRDRDDARNASFNLGFRVLLSALP